MCLTRCLPLAVLLLAPSSLAAEASKELERARGALKGLAFEEAAQAAARGLEAGDASPLETAELHFLIGQASAVLGRADAAQRAFARALELSPGLELPLGASPKLAEPFQAARTALKGARLAIAPSGEVLANGRARVQVHIHGDVELLVDHGVLRFGFDLTPGEVPLTRTDPPEASLPCPAPPCAYSVSLFDRAGNGLLEAGSATSPLFVGAPAKPVPPSAPPATTSQDARVWYRRPWPWLGAAVASAVATGLFAWQFTSARASVEAITANPGDFTWAQAQAADSSQKLFFGLTLGSSVLTAAFGAGAVAVW
ncbi:MAG: tetratricopeptide repeat protein [Myxococcales bacterium]|nr:tetratricopeptide repeat protein [Myxococcales bacterium]